ncbi:HAD family hydrolase [Sedimentitalea todarodis]|uniref:HAD family hydrolase n=1 Tax=Sedimentitalea todarodis TaxID=1631240 RepID=A0ABU3VFK9_9RHOB|nr:HAD family hydrolase [Sedimentitalea todarodis]MDU9004873.1 HAD family hydrolase [Sedimentitalea todarodis]
MITRSLCLVLGLTATSLSADPLPSWNDTEAKARIIDFVTDVTDPDSEMFVVQADRIAVFDNDGTLWAEQPVYFQLIYGIDVVARKGAEDPAFLTSDALRAAAAGDMKALMATGQEGLIEVLDASHAGMSVDAFQANVLEWLDTARHPKTGMRYDEMLYQPMLELLRYLRDEGFETYIVSGGGVHFMRAFAENAYNIPPEQVIGSTMNSSYQIVEGVPTVVKDAGFSFIDDKEGKPIAIDSKIGKRPIFAGGNSDGDFQMLEWTTAGDGPRLGLIVHHTDAAREFAYDRDSHIGKLVRGLDEGPERGWLIVDIAKDWEAVWPSE